MRILVVALAAAACSKSSQPPPPKQQLPAAQLPHDDRFDDGALGATTFALSQGTPEARARFVRGVLALHSFWYDEARRQFEAAIAADPTLTMAYWGDALSYCKLYWGDDDVQNARKAISRIPDLAHASAYEQAWVHAVIELLRADNVRASRAAFLAAMEQLHKQFPDDESATFLALALLSTTHRGDPDDRAIRERAAELAIGVFKHNPKHPGAAHYLIHAYDTPELAERALPYARAYAQIAPAAFHARHMPAHIFSRLGMWQDALTSCQAAWDASVAEARREKLSANHHDLHSLNWLVEIPFELGHRKDADAALALFASTVKGGLGYQQRALYATQVGSYLTRTGEWKRVDELLAPLQAPAAEDTPPPQGSPLPAMEALATLDTRVRAAAMQHDVAATKRLLDEIDHTRHDLDAYLQATQSKDAIAKIDQGLARRRAVMLARATKDDAALVRALREAEADADAETGGENNPSGALVHEDLGDALRRLGKDKEALAEYELAIAKHPNRARAMLGAARTAAHLGNAAAAQSWYRKLATQWATADADTDGLAEVRKAAGT